MTLVDNRHSHLVVHLGGYLYMVGEAWGWWGSWKINSLKNPLHRDWGGVSKSTSLVIFPGCRPNVVCFESWWGGGLIDWFFKPHIFRLQRRIMSPSQISKIFHTRANFLIVISCLENALVPKFSTGIRPEQILTQQSIVNPQTSPRTTFVNFWRRFSSSFPMLCEHRASPAVGRLNIYARFQ